MTDLTVKCPSCSALLKLADASFAGKKVRCPKCKGVVPVPADLGSAPPAPPPMAAPVPQAVAKKEQQPSPAPRPNPSTTTKAKPADVKPRQKKSKVPLILTLFLLFFFLLCGGVAVVFSRNETANRQRMAPSTRFGRLR